MDGYAASWHIQWLKGTLARIHPKSMTGYIIALKLRFRDKDTKDEAYADLENVRYEGCIRIMFTQIQTFIDKVVVTGAVLTMLILELLPQRIIEQLHTVNLTGKIDQEIITIITNIGQNAEKSGSARKSLGLQATLRSDDNILRNIKGLIGSYDPKTGKIWINQREPRNSVRRIGLSRDL
jgi:hypothetical protein